MTICPSCLHSIRRDGTCNTASIDGCDCTRCGGAEPIIEPDLTRIPADEGEVRWSVEPPTPVDVGAVTILVETVTARRGVVPSKWAHAVIAGPMLHGGGITRGTTRRRVQLVGLPEGLRTAIQDAIVEAAAFGATHMDAHIIDPPTREDH